MNDLSPFPAIGRGARPAPTAAHPTDQAAVGPLVDAFNEMLRAHAAGD